MTDEFHEGIIVKAEQAYKSITTFKPTHRPDDFILQDYFYLLPPQTTTRVEIIKHRKPVEDKRTDEEKVWDALSKPVPTRMSPWIAVHSMYATFIKTLKDEKLTKDDDEPTI